MTEGPALMQTATSQCFSVKLIGGVGIKILKLALTLSLPTKKSQSVSTSGDIAQQQAVKLGLSV